MIGAKTYPKSVIHAIVHPANQLTSTMTQSTDSTATAEDTIELWTMAAIAFLIYYGNYMVPPLVPTFSHEFGVTPYRLGWLVPGYSIAYGIATLVYGVLSDLRSRIPVLRILLLLASSTSLLISFATTARELIIFRILCGLGCGGMATIALAFIGDRYPYSVQGRPMGKIFGAVAAGMGLGSSLGPILDPLIGWRNEFRIIACGFVLIAILLGRRMYSFVHANQMFARCRTIVLEYLSILKAPRGGRTMAFIFLNAVFQGGIFAWLGLLIAERYHLREAGIGIVLLGYGLPDILFGGIIGGWADRYGRRYVIPLGFLWAGVCGLFLALPTSSFLTALVITALSVGFEATHPAMSSITTSLDPGYRGQITGLATFSKFLGMAVGSLLFERLMHVSFGTALIVFAMFQILVGLAAIYAFRGEYAAIPVALGQNART
jgi:predicted MFS family arabinose efflux permease